MPVFRIPTNHLFPEPRLAEPDGLLGIGGDLDPERLLLAYRLGIFPWYSEGQPILWWSPDPRFVLRPSELRVARSLAKRIRRGDYAITVDRAFADVVSACATAPRDGQEGTWITEEMQEAYVELYRRGRAHSCEAWSDGELVGGLYGVAVGAMFCGESMFARRADASKVAFVTLVRALESWGFGLVDCQVETDHLARFGAVPVDREVFLQALEDLRAGGPPVGRWTLPDLTPRS